MFTSIQVNQLLFVVLKFFFLMASEGGVQSCSSLPEQSDEQSVSPLKRVSCALRNSRTEQQESSWSCNVKPYSSITICSMLGFWCLLFMIFQLKRGMLYCCLFFFFLLRTVWWWVYIPVEILLQIHCEFLLPNLKSKQFAVWAAAIICCQNSLKTKKVILLSLNCGCLFACWEYYTF